MVERRKLDEANASPATAATGRRRTYRVASRYTANAVAAYTSDRKT